VTPSQTASKAQVVKLQKTVDHIVQRLDNDDADQVARDSRFERLLAWARKVSEKTGIPLEDL
jgi:hypothetical protein